MYWCVMLNTLHWRRGEARARGGGVPLCQSELSSSWVLRLGNEKTRKKSGARLLSKKGEVRYTRHVP